MRDKVCSSMNVGRIERELEIQITESFEQSGALREDYQSCLESLRKDGERRLADVNRRIKRQRSKWRAQLSSVEREKACVLQQAIVFQEQLAVSTSELQKARDRVFKLELETQHLRSRPSHVVMRSDPGMVAEATRVWDRATTAQDQARLAQRAAFEACEASFEREIDSAYSRLLTVQGSFAGALEDNVKLQRELEAERLKSAIAVRRVESTIEQNDTVLANIRRDSARVQLQRDRVARDYAALRVEHSQSKRLDAVRRLLLALDQKRHASMAVALRVWAVWTLMDRCLKQRIDQERRHASEVDSLEADVRCAETRSGDAQRRSEALQRSRARVADAVAMASQRRNGLAMEAVKRGAPPLQWCFWGWARVTRTGAKSMAASLQRFSAEHELAGVREKLNISVRRAGRAESESGHHRVRTQILEKRLNEREEELTAAVAALDIAQSLNSKVRNRSIHLGCIRLSTTLARYATSRLAAAFSRCIAPARARLLSSTAEAVKHSKITSEISDDLITMNAMSGSEAFGKDRQRPAYVKNTATGNDGLSRVNNVDRENQFRDTPQRGDVEGQGWVTRETETELKGAKTAHNEAQTTCHCRSEILNGVSRAKCLEDERESAPGPADETNSDACTSPPPLKDVTTQVEEGRPNDGDVNVIWTTNVPTVGKVRHLAPPSNHLSGRNGNRCVYTKKSHRPSVVVETADDFISRTPGHHTRGRNPSAMEMTDLDQIFNKETSHSGGTSSTCTRDEAPDFPRLILTLRAAVGRALYTAGERLLRCVEADHRERHGGFYRPLPLTRAEREQFRICLDEAGSGRLRDAVLAFLRTQASYRAIAVERDHAEKRTRAASDRSKRATSVCGGDNNPSVRAVKSRTTRKASKADGNVEEWKADERTCYISSTSIVTGPTSNPAEKAAAARVLRERLMALLENAEDEWEKHRRPWQRHRGREAKKHLRKDRTTSRTRCKGTEECSAIHIGVRNGSLWGLPYLDSGAGPRRLWDAVAGPMFVDATWSVQPEVIEEHLWRLAILVRDQSRGPPIALNRRDFLRRIVDLRMYEILLLHVRTQIIWDGVDHSGHTGCTTLDTLTLPLSSALLHEIVE